MIRKIQYFRRLLLINFILTSITISDLRILFWHRFYIVSAWRCLLFQCGWSKALNCFLRPLFNMDSTLLRLNITINNANRLCIFQFSLYYERMMSTPINSFAIHLLCRTYLIIFQLTQIQFIICYWFSFI